MRRKAQIRIGESMAVMIVFFFMLMFGYTFYTKMQQQDFYQTLKENTEKESIQIAQKMYFLPELQCSKGVKLVRESCYDKYKVINFINHLDDPAFDARSYYWETLGTSKVEYYPVFPEYNLVNMGGPLPSSASLDPANGDPLYIIYDFSEMAEERGMKSGDVVNMPISLYDPIKRTYEFGYIKVTIFYRSIQT